MNDLILITGGTGKTGGALAQLLKDHGAAHRIASRRAEIPFDWTAPDTWTAALNGVQAIYLVAPMGVDDPYSRMIEFLKLAKAQGVRRYVLLSMALLPAGGPAHGQVHQWLIDNTDDWAALCPAAFMQNFSEGPSAPSIRAENTIYSNTRDGQVSFIDAADIADAARAVLLAPSASNDTFTITGEEAISYDRVAELISEACGRPISHTRISGQEMADRMMARGLPEATARMLAGSYEFIATGGASKTTDTFRALTGRSPTSFAAFARAHADHWAPK